MKVILKSKSPQKEVLFEVSSIHVSLGRGDKAHVQVLDENCSRVHCKFYVEDNKLWIEDAASKNGTYVNGVRIQRSQLFLQDKVLVGDTEIFIPSEKNAPAIVKLLEFHGNTEDRQRKGLEVDDQNEIMTQIRMNPISAIKAPSLATNKSKRQLASNAMFKDSMNPTIPKEDEDPRLQQKWRFVMASLIDNLGILLAMGIAPFAFYVMGFTKTKTESAGFSDIKLLTLLAGASLVLGLIFWLINTKNSGGTIGERLSGVADAIKNSKS
ncbi:MAG: FHA domain-containing protein [Bacteriovoracaceae bacterium]|nr:FHA domain-containing protein [Bacteriovoracaceae bacterium]